MAYNTSSIRESMNRVINLGTFTLNSNRPVLKVGENAGYTFIVSASNNVYIEFEVLGYQITRVKSSGDGSKSFSLGISGDGEIAINTSVEGSATILAEIMTEPVTVLEREESDPTTIITTSYSYNKIYYLSALNLMGGSEIEIRNQITAQSVTLNNSDINVTSVTTGIVKADTLEANKLSIQEATVNTLHAADVIKLGSNAGSIWTFRYNQEENSIDIELQAGGGNGS